MAYYAIIGLAVVLPLIAAGLIVEYQDRKENRDEVADLDDGYIIEPADV